MQLFSPLLWISLLNSIWKDPSLRNYFYSTRTATYGFLAAVPLLLAYEILIVITNPSTVEIRVGADIWIKQLLATLGVQGQHALALVTIGFGLTIFFAERKKTVGLKFTYFPLLFLESLFYSIFLAVIIAKLVGYISSNVSLYSPVVLQITPSVEAKDFWLQIALSIGAGLYEELFFRVLLVSGLYFLFRNMIFQNQINAYVTAALLAALFFSAVHYIGPFGDTLAFSSFIFRFLFGLAFNALYVLRGFGVVAWTHALYDILLTISLKS